MLIYHTLYAYLYKKEMKHFNINPCQIGGWGVTLATFIIFFMTNE